MPEIGAMGYDKGHEVASSSGDAVANGENPRNHRRAKRSRLPVIVGKTNIEAVCAATLPKKKLH